MNHNASYLFEIDGITVWERLRCIRNFLLDNETAVELAELNIEKTNYKLANMSDSIEDRFERREIEIESKTFQRAYMRGKDEVAFLRSMEQELTELAEKTRIPGKTDEEMYEINFYNEIIARNVRKAHCEFVAHGSITSLTMDQLVRCPPTLRILNEQGILKADNIFALLESGKQKDVDYAKISYNP